MIYQRLRHPDIGPERITPEAARRADNRFTWIVITTLVFGIIALVVVMS